MATGVPRKGSKNGTGLANQIELTYPGKQSVETILAAAPISITKLQPLHSSTLGNRLYFGENLGILAALRQDPTVADQVKLIYIDPPFATQTVFHSRKLQHAYEDVLAGADFLEFLRTRLIFLRELLADDGSIYVHLDDKMVFHVKLIMDELFGSENFRNCITRKKCNPKNYTRKQYGNISDYILFYSKSTNYIWNKPVEPWTEERAKEYQYVEPDGRRFMKVPVHAPGIRNGETGKPWRDKLPPPGKHWQYPPATLDEMDARGEIYWSANGNPRRKVYLDENPGIGVQDIWLDYKDAHNQNIEITGYPTEKNPELLKRIIEASSNPGDLVLDCFSGSGTTLAVAHALGRRWIGVDNSSEAINSILKRFFNGMEPMGDFVSTSLATSSKAIDHEQQQLSLFGTDPKSQLTTQTVVKRNSIHDFDFLVTDDFREEGSNIWEKWRYSDSLWLF
jgi:adenine-specific DNA-methyltransferase